MRRVETNDPDRLAYQESLGCGTLVVLPAALAALVGGDLLWANTFGSAARDESGIQLPLTAGFALLTVVPVVAFLVRAGVQVGFEIDRARRTVTASWGFFTPSLPTTYPLDRFRHLAIVPRVGRTRTGSNVRYELVLAGPGDENVLLGRADRYDPVRSLAEEVGRFVHLDVLDLTASPPVLRKAEALGRPLKEVARQAKGPARDVDRLRLPAQPASRRIGFETSGNRAVFRLPPQGGFGCLGLAVLLAGAAVGLVVYVGVASGEPVVAALWCGISALFVVPALLLGCALLPSRTTVEAGAGAVCVEVRGTGGVRRTLFHADRVRELRRAYRSVTVYSDREPVSIGCPGAPEEEVEWMRAVLERVVSS